MVIYSLCRRLNVFQPRLLRYPLRHPKTSKSDGMQRQVWSSSPYCQRLNVFQSRLLKSPLLSRDNQVRWHAETNMVISFLCRRLNVFRPRLLQSPLHHLETIKSNGTLRQVWSSAPFCRRLNVFRQTLLKSPLRHLEAIKSNDMWRPSWSSAFVVSRLF